MHVYILNYTMCANLLLAVLCSHILLSLQNTSPPGITVVVLHLPLPLEAMIKTAVSQ